MRRALRGELTQDGMAAAMVGRELQDFYPDKGQPGTEIALELRGLTVPATVSRTSREAQRSMLRDIAGADL